MHGRDVRSNRHRRPEDYGNNFSVEIIPASFGSSGVSSFLFLID